MITNKLFLSKMKSISKYYHHLTKYTKENKIIGSTNEWVVDNFYLLSEQKQIIESELISLKIVNVKKKRRDELDKLVNTYLESVNYSFYDYKFFSYAYNIQSFRDDYFKYDEIDYILTSLKVQTIKKIAELTKLLDEKLKVSYKVSREFKSLAGKKNIDFEKYINKHKEDLNSNYYLLEVSRNLNKFEDEYDTAMKLLNEIIEAKNLSFKDILKIEQNKNTSENILMINLFSALKAISKIKHEVAYKKISYTEKTFENENANVYLEMLESSKVAYRSKLKELNLKLNNRKIKEIDLAEQIVLEANLKNEHLGFELFKNKKFGLRAKIYVFSIIFFSILLLNISANFSSPWSYVFWMIPILGFVIDIFNQILFKEVNPTDIFKLELENDVPKELATMIVIPTITKDAKKVDEMFENLELYYLANKSKNLYFTLLGDAAASKQKDEKYDIEVVNAGARAVKRLNNKYGKGIFNFAYRNRFFNEGENVYLGYERKRGALGHFNKLLLGKLSNDEIASYFRFETLSELVLNVNIKYVITLDADTKMVLNTAFKLIGAMAHPLNKPILNEKGNKVIKGHAIMQPKIAYDVEVTNKSEYAQLFAGLGGLDSYALKHFDLYQDIFDEGIFQGKGIYDLEMFEKVLGEMFPENLILSHDLIEGSFLRCGYISDVELIDGFPSRYLNDAMRHHRWTRGDWQIISYLKGKITNLKKEKITNPLNTISKWKIFDNLRRSLMSPTLFLLIMYTFLFSKYNPVNVTIAAILIISVPLLFYLVTTVLRRQKHDIWLKYYLNLITGLLAVVNKTLIIFALLPYEAKLYIDAIMKALYRMFVSKKNLLNWMTSEEVEAISNNSLASYIKTLKINFIASFVLMLGTAFFRGEYLAASMIVSVAWLVAPFIMFHISRDIKTKITELSEEENNEITEAARRTWKFFEDGITEANNYLIPDNYQLNRHEKFVGRTSSTNIGYSLTSIISAFELGFITEEKALHYIENVISTVEKLEKWHGHLFNWYDIRELKAIQPFFISTADSGNFIATLITTKNFVARFSDSLEKRLYLLIKASDFSKLYNSESNVFSIGYSLSEGSLSPYHYNNFLSEARLASFVAIAKEDVPYKHWFSLDKTLTKHRMYKGIVSWTGTMFEYFMPYIFMNSYEHTILDETYQFAFYVNKKFIKEVNRKLPFGITESAYHDLDDSENYLYKAFGIPYLKFHDDEKPRIVVAPYASILALAKYPKDVYENMKKFKKLKTYGEYGFFESYDYHDKEVVDAYYAHHQGMILASITNYLKNDVIKNYFSNDKKIKSVNILLKEKVQLKTYIDLEVAKYKKNNYKRENNVNDIREINKVSNFPSAGVLSNGLYTVYLNDFGYGFSKYKNLMINRFNRTSSNQGFTIYLKNNETGKVWTNTYNKNISIPDKYSVVYASDRVKYSREDEGVITKTEIMVTKEHTAEIRKITIANNTESAINLEVTSYSEVIMARKEEDIAHPLFNSITIDCEKDIKTRSLIFKRRSRTKENTNYYIVNRFFEQEDQSKEFEFETSRANFIGQYNDLNRPEAVFDNKILTSNEKDLIDPIMSIRKNVKIASGASKVIYLLVGFGKSEEQVMEIVANYSDEEAIEDALELVTAQTNMNNKYSNISPNNLKVYADSLKYFYEKIIVTNRKEELLMQNKREQNTLWKYGITGNLPIIFVRVKDATHFDYIKKAGEMFEYYQSRGIYVDLLISNEETSDKKTLITKYVDDLIYRVKNVSYYEKVAGNIFMAGDALEDELNLFEIVAGITIDSSRGNFFEQLNSIANEIDEKLVDISYEKGAVAKSLKHSFINNGTEYEITGKTPKPWSNIICNDKFGFLITNNMGGFTYAYNSRENKLTEWSNNYVEDTQSERFIINDEIVTAKKVVHGFGYSKFFIKESDYELVITAFVPEKDPIKVYDFKVIKVKGNKLPLEISFEIKPVMGVSREFTFDKLVAQFSNESNSMIISNTYNSNYKDEQIFMTSSLNINSYDEVGQDYKRITVLLTKKEDFAFYLGTNPNIKMLTKYQNYMAVQTEFDNILAYWENKLGSLKVETPDSNFNHLMNGWLLYQVYASRLMARVSLYQVGGAIGFRDQLQDSLSLIISNPAYTRDTILNHAKHQFEDGSVLHWWHEDIKFGSRTTFSDDYLWLIYVTYEYLKTTEDKTILDEMIPFVRGPELDGEPEKGINYEYTDSEASLYEHMKLAIKRAVKRVGEHDLPLMGCGDWNDGMNKIGHKNKGESVFVGFFLYDLLGKFSEITDEIALKGQLFTVMHKLKSKLNQHAWDEDWYLRAYYDDGTKVGKKGDSECEIDLLSQTWSILSKIADTKKINKIIPEIEKRLVDKEAGIIKLLSPPFSKAGKNPGYISDYISGVRENGGQYTHASLWYIKALNEIGKKDMAFNHFNMIAPYNKPVTIYKNEPYVVSADIYSNEVHLGEGGWSWYTGSASWTYKVAIENILGFKKEGNKLKITPNFPKEWKKIKYTYKYAETIYEIEVCASDETFEIILNSNKAKEIIKLGG